MNYLRISKHTLTSCICILSIYQVIFFTVRLSRWWPAKTHTLSGYLLFLPCFLLFLFYFFVFFIQTAAAKAALFWRAERNLWRFVYSPIRQPVKETRKRITAGRVYILFYYFTFKKRTRGGWTVKLNQEGSLLYISKKTSQGKKKMCPLDYRMMRVVWEVTVP